MRLFIYALGSVPVELLFSDSRRIRSDETHVDDWIPCGVTAEKFAGECFLHLEQEGFTFQQSKDSGTYEFLLLSPPYPQAAQFTLSCHTEKTNGKEDFRVKRLTPSTYESPASSESKMYILINQSLGLDYRRGALFAATRIDNNKVFLRYVDSLRLWWIEDTKSTSPTEESPRDICFGQSASSQHKFILERSSQPTPLCFPRPQTAEQYFPRLDILLWNVLPLIERYISQFTWEFWITLSGNSKIAFVAALMQSFLARWLFEKILRSVGHRAWIATYGQSWTPHGRWRWFWGYMNFHSPVAFKTYAKFVASVSFVACVLAKSYSGLMAITLYWLPLFDRKQLLNLYIWLFLNKLLDVLALSLTQSLILYFILYILIQGLMELKFDERRDGVEE